MSLNFLKFKGDREGFTTLELMVVIGIFTIMTGVVLANLPKFRDQTSVGLVAQQIALVARQAQVYGNSGRKLADGSAVQGYGLDINTAIPSSFILFGNKKVDPPGTQDYLYSPSPERIETFSLAGGIRISGVEWVPPTTGPTGCIPGGASPSIMRIIFRRAYPDAQFFSASGTSRPGCTCNKIIIESVRDSTLPKKEIVIWSTGHIYTRNANPGSC